MTDIEIIQLLPDQWRRYRDIRLEALKEEPQAFGTTYAEMLDKPPGYWQGRLIDAARGETSWLRFAQQGERLVGITGAFWIAEEAAAKIVSVYVSRAARGQGVGRALMEAVLAEVSRKPGIRKAALDVVKEQSVAVALYRALGFEVVGERQNLEGDGLVHAGYMMEKPVG